MRKLFTLLALLVFVGGNLKVNAAVSLTYVADFNNNKNLVDGTNAKWEGGATADMWCIFKTSVPISATSYVLMTGNDNADYQGRNWKNWTVFGGNFASDADAKNAARSTEGGWVALDVRENDNVLEDKNFTEYEFTMNQSDGNFYTYYLVKVTATKGATHMQMTEFSFKEYTVDTSAYDDLISSAKSFDTSNADAALQAEYATLVGTLDALKTAAASSGNFEELDAALTKVNKLQGYINGYASSSYILVSTVGETWGDGAAANLLDGNKNTKWGGNFTSGNIVWRLKEALMPLYYQLTAGGDTGSNTGRNWKSWAIYGANFASIFDATADATGWVELYSTEDGGMTTQSGATQDFDFTTEITESYQYFMVVLKSNASGGATQMADLNIIDGKAFQNTKNAALQELQDFKDKYDYSEATDELKSAFDNAVAAVGTSTYKTLTADVAAAWAAEKAMADYLASDEKFGAESVNISSGLDADVFTRKTPVEGGKDIVEGFDNDQTGFYTKTITVKGTQRTTNYGVPDDGILKTSTGHTYAFDYDNLNAVSIKKGETKTMTIDGDRQSKSWRFYFLGTASNGPADITATFNYKDGTTSQAQFQIYNWDTNNEETRAVTVYQTGRVDLWSTDNIQDNQNFRFYEIPAFVDQNKVITSISLFNSGESNGKSKAMVFGFCIVGKDNTAEMFYMGSNGYATYVPEVKDVDVSGVEGLTAYTATVLDNGWVHLDEVTKVPAGSAVVMKGNAGSYKLPYTTGAPALTGNELKAAKADVVADGTQYILAKGDEGVGFYKAKPETTIAAGKGYLVISAAAKGFFGIDENTNSIQGVKEQTTDGAIYNLAGQRLTQMQKGINIVGGKKVVK